MDTFFWMNKEDWPADFADNLFLARALHLVGRSIFGDQWTGSEPLVQQIIPLHRSPNHATNAHALAYLKRHRPELVENWPNERDPVSIGGTPWKRPKLLTRDLWQEALRLQRREVDVDLPPIFHRRDKAAEALGQLVASGTVATRLRPINGGAFVSSPPGYWHQKSIWHAMARCQVEHCWVFVDGPGLHKRLVFQPMAPSGPRSRDDAVSVLRNEHRKDGVLSQRTAEQLLPDWNRDAVRQLYREEFGTKRGRPRRKVETPHNQ
jgi:hypothetical protein